MIVRAALGFWLFQVPLVASQTTTFSGIVTGSDGYVTGTTATSISLTATFPNGVAAAGDTVTFTVGQALFTAGTLTSGITMSAGTWQTSWTATTIAITGTYTGSTTLTGPLTITITSASGSLAAAGLPPAGAVTLSASSADNGGGTGGDSAGTPANMFYTIAVPTVSLTSADMISGTTPSAMQIIFTVPKTLANGDTLDIVSNKQIFTAAASTGLTVTGTTLSSYSATNTYSLQLTSAGTAMGTSITLDFASPMLSALPAAAGTVLLDVNMGGITLINDAAGYGTVTAAAPGAGVSGDPVTWYGKYRTEFLLPMEQHTVILQTPDMAVLAWPFQGKGEDQWIGYVVVVSNTGDTIVEVAIRKNLLGFDRTKSATDTFETIDVIVGPSASPSRLEHIPSFNDQIDHPQGYVTQFARISTSMSAGGAACLKERYIPCRESVLVSGRYAKLAIESSSAVEYYGNSEAAVDHSHLDVQVFDMIKTESFSGVLPEIWGFQEMSNSTQAMIKSRIPVELALNSSTALVKSNTSEDMSIKSSSMISV